jgi:sugar lactone lactonase YvrE
MSTAWDISTATSDNLTVLVSGQETAPQGLFFKPDGTKVTIIGSSSDSVRSYNLSTAWNISTATYASEVISVVGRDANPSAIFIKPDGTKFWMLGFNNDTISQYSMSTAWNVSSATFDDQVLNIGAGESIPHGLQFSSDGTKLYVLGQAGRYIRQYNLSTAWDISSSSIPPATGTGYLYVGAQDISSQGIAFNDDGTKMYVIGAGNDRISQYTLSTPWSISSATYANKNFSVTDNETDPSGLYIKPDGTKFWIIGTVGDRIRQYSMNTPWDISTSVYDVITRSVGTTETFPTALFFKPDGTKMYFSGITSDAIQWYNLSTPWDITSGSLDAQNFSIASQGSNIGDMFFKPDGTRFYWVDTTLGTVFEYNLSTAWDIMSASYSRSYDARAVVANPQAFTFKPDGTKMYIGEAPYGFIYEYNIGS